MTLDICHQFLSFESNIHPHGALSTTYSLGWLRQGWIGLHGPLSIAAEERGMSVEKEAPRARPACEQSLVVEELSMESEEDYLSVDSVGKFAACQVEPHGLRLSI